MILYQPFFVILRRELIKRKVLTMNDTVRIKKSKEEIISAFRLMIAKKK